MNKVTQSIYKNAIDNSLFDNNGNFRFIVGDGTAGNISGMTVTSSKWSLNGSNLMFEILGSFRGSLSGFDILSTFTLPEWIVNKIAKPVSNIIDILTCDMVSTKDAASTHTKLQVTTDGINIYFTNATNVNVNDLSVFKIRYNIIIDY